MRKKVQIVYAVIMKYIYIYIVISYPIVRDEFIINVANNQERNVVAGDRYSTRIQLEEGLGMDNILEDNVMKMIFDSLERQKRFINYVACVLVLVYEKVIKR